MRWLIMANDINLFFSEKEKKYFFSGHEACHYCKKPIEMVIYIKKSYVKIGQKSDSTINTDQTYFCFKCVSKVSGQLYDVEEIRRAVVLNREDMPPDARAIISNKIELQASNGVSIFDVAVANDGAKVINHTLHADQISLEAAHVGKCLESDSDRSLDIYEITDYIKSLNPEIEEKPIQEIEVKE